MGERASGCNTRVFPRTNVPAYNGRMAASSRSDYKGVKQMSRPMTYPMGTMEVGDVATMPATNRGDPRRISRNVSQYGIRNGRSYKVRTVNGVAFITRLG
jgi:hypothetical protein